MILRFSIAECITGPSLIALLAAPAMAQILTPTPAQTPVPHASGSIAHVPIALPIKAPPDWDPETWTNFRRRCQEVADMSAANQPMGSGDYGYSDACTKEGAYYWPVKQRPRTQAHATTPMPTPGPDGHIPLGLPLTLPPGSPFESAPAEWRLMLAACQRIADARAVHEPINDSDWHACGTLRNTVRVYNRPLPPVESSPAGNAAPSPTATPTPLGQPQDPQSLNSNSPVGPFGTPFTGGGGDACVAGTPPDVAAGVSSIQIAELLNQGIWVFNKQGQIQSGFPKTLATFWAPNSPPPTNILTDTQIAFEPLSQRWPASTESVTQAKDDGDLYFAISNTADATGAWTFYDFPKICSKPDSTFPVPDQPILGYNQNWVVIDVSCFDQSKIPFTDNDQLLLVPHSAIATHPPNLGAIQEAGPTRTGSNGWFASRPSCDISGSANQNLFLVSSGPLDSPGSRDLVKITSIIDVNGNFVGPGAGGTVIQSPLNGVAATTTFSIALAQHDNCGANSACAVNLNDARISNAPILQVGNDGNKYLLTAFHAGDSANNTAQTLFFMGQVNSFATSPVWNEWFFDGPGFWATYPP